MMREIKDSGIEWIGAIPANWEVRKMRTLGKFTSSGIDKKIDPSEPLVSIINYTDIYGNSTHVLNKKEYMVVSAPQSKINENLVNKGDLIFTPSSETIEDIGLSALVDADLENTAFSYHVLRFQFEKEFYHSYKKYLCNNHFVWNWFSAHANGTIRQTLSRDDFKTCTVFVPPLEEQKAIADHLDKECARIDNLVAKQHKIIEKLKEYKKSVITEAVTRGLNPTAPMKDSGIEWIGKIPAHWEVRRIKTLGEYRNGLTYNPENMVDEEEGTLVLRSSNVQNGKLVFEDNVFVNSEIPDQLLVQKGDIIICSRNGSRELVGKNAIVKEDLHASFGAFMMVFRSQYPEYMNYILNSAIFSYYLSSFFTSTINQLTGGNFGNMRVVFCPDEKEQKAIIEYLDHKCEAIDSVIEKREQMIKLLLEYKRAFIYKSVTGKKDFQ